MCIVMLQYIGDGTGTKETKRPEQRTEKLYITHFNAFN